MTKEVCKEKQGLVEKLGVCMEQRDQLAPVAARIMSYIVLTGKVGTTFDDLVRDLCASKSTISTHLNHLTDLKMIVYFTKSGDRKKYYTVNPYNIIQSIDKMIDAWLAQKELHSEIKAYKEAANRFRTEEGSKFDLDFHNNYIKFLEEATESISTLKSKIVDNITKL